MSIWKRKKKKKDDKSDKLIYEPRPTPASLEDAEFLIKEHLQYSNDLNVTYITNYNKKIGVFFIKELTNAPSFNQSLIKPLKELKTKEISLDFIFDALPIGQMQITDDLKKVFLNLVRGYTYIHIDGSNKGILADISQQKERALTKGENETNVYGPQIAFTDTLTTNLAMVRQFLSTPMLAVESLKVGKLSQTKINILYIKGIANEQNINTLKQRISDIEFDGIINSSILGQLIADNTLSIFPQTRLSEQPDYFTNSLIEGKVGVLVDGSPYGLIGPCTLMSFFQTSQDYYQNWNKATFIRLLRFFGTLMSVFFTAVYVAALSYHYEIIPSAVLITLGETRAKVPFPPLIEALFLEFTIELLRESAARLPTKIGQTIGIVGGIVIGQAAVQAGFTSNILIIIVALSALASFTSPSYSMGTSIRILRFPIILMAGLIGGVGIVAAIAFIFIHLLRLKSYGNPYLAPLYPLRLKDFRDSIIRMPYTFYYRRPLYTRPKDKGRFSFERSRENKDIDE